MAYPASYYFDPLKGAIAREYGRVGCPACIHREKRADGSLKCAVNSVEWPDGVMGSCKQWLRRANKK